MGKPLDTEHEFVTPLVPAVFDRAAASTYETGIATARPEARRSILQIQMAEDQREAVESAYRPQVGFLGFYEADRRYWATSGAPTSLALNVDGYCSIFTPTPRPRE